MSEKSFVFGAGTLAKVLLYHLEQAGRAPEGFVVDDAWCSEETFCGLPLVPFSSITERFPAAEYGVYVAVGYGKMNDGRREIFERLRALGYRLLNFIHSSVINDAASIGEGNIIFSGTVLDVFTELGDGNIFYNSVLIGHGCKIGNFNFFAGRSALAGEVVVGDRCFFGLNCTVTNALAIPDRCFVGAGAFAVAPIPEGGVLAAPRSVLLEKDSETIIKKVM